MALSLVLNFILAIFSIVFRVRWFYFLDKYEMILNINLFLTILIFILAILAVFLFCKKLKSYKMFIYFLAWYALAQFSVFPILELIDKSSFVYYIFMIMLYIAYFACGFLFFKNLVQVTKEKIFYFIFMFFICSEALHWLLMIMHFNIKIVVRNSMYYYNFVPSIIVYHVAF